MTFDDLHLASILVSTVRNAPVLIFAAMAGLFAERSGVIDIGLEGKILASAFASAAVAFATQNPWYGVGAGMLVSIALATLQAYVAITQKGNQLVAGIAINIAMSGLTFVLAQFFFQQGGRTPDLGQARLFDVVLPGSAAVEGIPFLGWFYAHLIGGHSVLVYLAFALVPIVHWVVYHSRFGLRLRACGENRHAALFLGRLSGDRAERLLPARHVGRRRLSGADGDGVRELATGLHLPRLPDVRLLRRRADPDRRRRPAGDRPHSRFADPDGAVCGDGDRAGRPDGQVGCAESARHAVRQVALTRASGVGKAARKRSGSLLPQKNLRRHFEKGSEFDRGFFVDGSTSRQNFFQLGRFQYAREIGRRPLPLLNQERQQFVRLRPTQRIVHLLIVADHAPQKTQQAPQRMPLLITNDVPNQLQQGHGMPVIGFAIQGFQVCDLIKRLPCCL